MSSSLKSALVSEALMSRSRKANLSSTIRNICIASIDKNFEKYFIAFSLYTWVKFLGILKNYIIIVEA
jgi:predicted DNA-binding ribbon-helix-helix protein